MNQTQAAVWRARAQSLRRAADAIESAVSLCEQREARQPTVRARILAALTCADTMTTPQIRAAVRATNSTVASMLCRMLVAGQIERVGYATYRLPIVHTGTPALAEADNT